MAASPVLHNWVYDKGSATPGSGGGGTPDIPAAPPVVIDSSAVRDIYDGSQQIGVWWHPAATATTDNFKGVAVYLEDPDLSALPSAPLDGSAKLDGSAQLSGTWNPKLETQTADSPATMILDGQPVARNIRVYLAAYGNAKNAVLVRANKSGATPSVVIAVPAVAGAYVRGQEYALLIRNASIVVVDDFDNPAGPQYHMNFYYDEPTPIPLPPGMDAFGGVQTVYEYPSGQRVQAKFLDAKKPETWVSDSYPAVTGTFRVWFASADINQRVDSIVPGVTPYVDVTIKYPPDGSLTSPVVTGFAITNNRWTWQPDGTIFEQADLSWTPPDSARYAGVEFWQVGINGVQLHPPVKLGDAGDVLSFFGLQIINWPKTAQNWTIVAIAYDYTGKLSDDPNALSPYSPEVVWTVGPPQTGNAPLIDVSGVAITFEQELSSDGVVRMRTKITGWVNPPGNQYGGCTIARVWNNDTAHPTTWDAGLTDTSLTTPWEPAPSPDSGQTTRTWDFYFVSRDPQGVRNSILQGTTPKVTKAFTPMAGQVVVTRPGTAWWNTDEFVWPSGAGGLFTALNFVAAKIFVGSVLRVGGGTAANAGSFGGQQNGQIAVFNADIPTNKIVAWMGQQNDPTKGTIFGGWFAQLYVGGAGPPTAPLFADNTGVVVVGGIAAPPGGTYPYISIRNETGNEVGRIGALVAGPGQGNSGPLVPTNDPAYIAGAWFKQLGIGGSSLADWRVLAGTDNTVKLRNINLFTIAWPANVADVNNPSNAATTLVFGYDAFHAPVAGDSRYWKFPGFQLYNTNSGPTGLGINLITRGLVINGPTLRLGSFVAFNGDQFGSDSGTFWADLSMYSPVSGSQNVYLRSSDTSGKGDAYFALFSHLNATMIEVTIDGVGNPVVHLGGSLTNYNGSATLIDASGRFTGSGVIVTGDVQTGGSFKVTNGLIAINNLGQFVGAGVLCPNNGIGAAGFNPWNGSQYLTGMTSTFKDQAGRTVTVTGGVITSIV